MKEIEIIINGDKLERVKRILSAFSKNGIFVSQGFGYGHQQGYHQVYTRDDNRGVNMLPRFRFAPWWLTTWLTRL